MSALLASIPAVIVLTGALVGAAAALPGLFLVLRGSAMLTDAVSHAIVFGIVVTWMLTGALTGPLQLLGAALAGLLCVWLAEALAATRLVRTDAAIGLAFPALFAAGVLLINLNARNLHLDADAVLLGQIGLVWLDSVPVAGVEVPRTLLALAGVLVLNAVLAAAFWKELALAAFDPGYAAALGFRPRLIGYGLLAVTAVTAVTAFEAVGAVLFVAFAIIPPATALLLTDRLGAALALAVALAVGAAGAGYALAAAWDVSIAGMMALVAAAAFAAVALLAPGRGVIARRRALRAARGADDQRALLAHLLTHGGDGPGAREETEIRALREHLMWEDGRARRILARATAAGLVRRVGDRLHLTEAGRAAAAGTRAPHAGG